MGAGKVGQAVKQDHLQLALRNSGSCELIRKQKLDQSSMI